MNVIAWAALIYALIVVVTIFWFSYEAVTAPLVDKDERVIDDPYGRMK